MPTTFQSTHPVWGATERTFASMPDFVISIHAPRVGCDGPGWSAVDDGLISIHAPRVGCDAQSLNLYRILEPISIHAPRVGCDPPLVRSFTSISDFNPRTPCGVRPGFLRRRCWRPRISIHAPRVGCDVTIRIDEAMAVLFQSTHPVWGATRRGSRTGRGGRSFQSTHPVWGATTPYHDGSSSSRDFNPRTPCGVRHDHLMAAGLTMEFQSTHPVWGATWPVRVEIFAHWAFQSTHPVWGATGPAQTLRVWGMISIHAPRVGCDVFSCCGTLCKSYFNPRTPCGVRLRC